MLELASRIVFLAVAVVLIGSTSAFAAQRYAKPGGDGPVGSCPSADPCSIQNAVLFSSTNDGDEVILAPGDYNIGATAIDLMDAIDVHGQSGPSQTRILGTAGYVAYLGNSGAKLRNVSVIHTVGILQAVSINAGTIDHVIATSTAGNGCTVMNATITDSMCVSDRSGGGGILINTSGGTHTMVLRNVTAIGRGATNSTGLYAGLSVSGSLTFDAKNVVAVGTTNDVYASSAAGAPTTVTLDHSNFSSVLATGPETTVSPTGANSNQTAEPVFVDAPGGDYHQAIGSPTIDSGAVDGLAGTTDIDGDARIGNAIPDIGADEIADVDAPAMPAFTSPVSPFLTNDSTPTIQGTAENLSTVKLLDGPTEVCSTSAAGGNFSCDTAALAEGTHSIRATATDSSGNESSITSTSITVIVDVTAPTVVVTGPANGSTTSDSTPRATFDVTDANPGSSQCSVDGGAFAACVSGTELARLADGAHTIDVRHTDAAGNAGTGSVSFNIDATAPQTTFAGKPKRKSTKRKVKIKFRSTEAGSTFQCKLDKGKYKPCRSPYKKRVKPGKHALRVIATDSVGNTDPTPAKIKWTVLAD